jgi:F-box and WD-40 domain protein CDC4
MNFICSEVTQITVRCLAIVKPQWLDIAIEGGGIKREKWSRAMIVTGSTDHSLRVWMLPRPGDEG